ncbi:MAG: hypothetical protein Q8N58_02580 [bacterium]|nr:hypothetical protein [bacterium]
MNFIQKIRNQPKYIRKIILWSITIIFGLILIGLWIYLSGKSVRNFNKQSVINGLNLPKIENFNTNEQRGNNK